MAYDKETIEKEAIEVIRKEKLTFFTDLQIYLEASLATLYNHELEKLESIKRELAINRLSKKKKLRGKWEDSDNPALQIAAYKLMADEDELVKLTSNKHEVTGKDGGPIQTQNKHVVEFRDMTNGNSTNV
jgi:hypothetical protein